MCGAQGGSSSSETKFVKLSFKNASEIIKRLKEAESVEIKKDSPKPAPVQKEKRLLISNDPLLNVQCFCNVCSEVFYLSDLSKHVKVHRYTFPEYVKKFGNPRSQLVRIIKHNCGICQELVLLNVDDITQHIRSHNIGYSAYAAKYMKKGAGLVNPDVPEKTKASPVKTSPQSPVAIKCGVCFKTFKHNKQLSVHMRKH